MAIKDVAPAIPIPEIQKPTPVLACVRADGIISAYGTGIACGVGETMIELTEADAFTFIAEMKVGKTVAHVRATNTMIYTVPPKPIP